MVIELKKGHIKTLMGLVTEEMDRVREDREKQGFHDPGYFSHLVGIRNRLMTTLLDEEPLSSISDEEWRQFLRGERGKK